MEPTIQMIILGQAACSKAGEEFHHLLQVPSLPVCGNQSFSSVSPSHFRCRRVLTAEQSEWLAEEWPIRPLKCKLFSAKT